MDALSTAVSGLQAASLQLDVSANNVANVSTPGFRPSRVALASAAGGGVTTRIVPGQAPPTLPGVPASEQPSGTDLVGEIATLVEAPLTYAANARVVRADVETTRSLLDVLG